MKKKELEKIGKELSRRLPGFTAKGDLVVMCPINTVLRGICFDGSGFDKRGFYVQVFFLPLCTPTHELYFSMGQRLRTLGHNPGQMWSIDMPGLADELEEAVRKDALPFLAKAESLESMIDVLKTSAKTNFYGLRAMAYSLARLGRFTEAVEELSRAVAMLGTRNWEVDLAVEASQLKKDILENPELALARLERWESETRTALKLDRFCD